MRSNTWLILDAVETKAPEDARQQQSGVPGRRRGGEGHGVSVRVSKGVSCAQATGLERAQGLDAAGVLLHGVLRRVQVHVAEGRVRISMTNLVMARWAPQPWTVSTTRSPPA